MQQQTESLRQPRYTKAKFVYFYRFGYFWFVASHSTTLCWDLARLVSFISQGTSGQGVMTACSGLPGSTKCFNHLL